MADRDFLIEILLKARDDTSAAFAKAAANIEAYDKLLDEQKGKLVENRVAHEAYSHSIENSNAALKHRKESLEATNLTSEKSIKSELALEAAQRKVSKMHTEETRNAKEYKLALIELDKADKKYIDTIKKEEGLSADRARIRANQIRTLEDDSVKAENTARKFGEIARQEFIQAEKKERLDAQVAARGRQRAKERIAAMEDEKKAAESINAETEKSRVARERRHDEALRRYEAKQEAADNAERKRITARDTLRERITREADRPSQVLASSNISRSQYEAEEKAERDLVTVRKRLIQTGLTYAEAEARIQEVRQHHLRDAGFATEGERALRREEMLSVAALKELESATKRVTLARKSGRTPEETDIRASKVKPDLEGAPSGGLFGQLVSGGNKVQELFGKLTTSTQGFDSAIRNAMGIATVASIQPLIALILGLVGAFGALYSAVVAAGGALVGIFVSGAAQAIPVVGLLGAAMQRLQAIMSFVTTSFGQLQQRFIAGFITAKQNAEGINQVAIAEHGLADAQFQSQLAAKNVAVAQLGLMNARIQATRQLQDLIFAETNARLAAEASTLSVTDAQKALQFAIQTGGDVQQAQLALQQAQVGHVQAGVQATRAVQDAAKGSVQRQEISQQIRQAQIAVQESQHALVDAQFAIAQARAAVVEARLAASGYNVGTAAQLAYLRSQMTQTERELADNILKIFKGLQSVTSPLRKLTDAILQPFIGITNRIMQVFKDPRLFSAFQGLATAIGNAIKSVGSALLSGNAISAYEQLLAAATQNMPTLTKIFVDLLRAFGGIATAVAPFLHTFLVFLSHIADRFAAFATQKGKNNPLKDFFDEAFKSLMAFVRLGEAIARFIFDVVGKGGGAKTGIGLIATLTRNINRLSSEIEHHGNFWKTLQKIWAAVGPALHALGTIFGAIGHAMVQIGGSKEGKSALQAFADLIAGVIVPALVQFVKNVGAIVGEVTRFLTAHPLLAKLLTTFISMSLTVGFLHKGLGVLLGPLGVFIGLTLKLPLMVLGLNKVAHAFRGIAGEIGGATRKLIEFARHPISRIRGTASETSGAAGTAGRGGLGNAIRKAFSTAVEIIAPIMPGLDAVRVFVVNEGFGGGGGKRGAKETQAAREATAAETASHGRPKPGEATRTAESAKSSEAVKNTSKFGEAAKNAARSVYDHSTVLKGASAAAGKLRDAAAVAATKARELGGALSGNLKYMRAAAAVRISEAAQVLRLSKAGEGAAKTASIGRTALGALGKLPFFDAAAFGLGALTTSGGVNNKLVGGAETLDPTSLLSMVPGLGGFKGAIGTILESTGLLGRANAGGPLVAASPEIAAMRAQSQGVPAAFADRLAFGKPGTTAKEIVDKYREQIQSALDAMKPIDLRSKINDAFVSPFKDVIPKIHGHMKTIKQSIGKDANPGLSAFTSNTAQTLNTYTGNLNQSVQATQSGISNINTQLKRALKALGAHSISSIVSNDVGQVASSIQNIFNPTALGLASGGFVGMMGERGRDGVHAVLGRGEAVLNYAHQRIVEPAMNAYYKFGLGEMFNRTKGVHAGGRGSGYATGGYVYPFVPSATISQVDQGIDLNMPVGSPIGPMGNAQIKGIIHKWYKGQPFIWWQLLDGARKGAYAYVAEQITNLASVGAKIAANQAVADYAASGTGIEYGWASANGQTLTQAIAPGQVATRHAGAGTTAGNDMKAFISGLSQGRIVNSAINVLSGLGGAAQSLQDLTVHGQGPLKDIVQRVLNKITHAANDKIGNTTGVPGLSGMLSTAGIHPGAWLNVANQIAKKMGWGPSEVQAWYGVESLEDGSLSLTATNPSGAYGLAQMLAPGGVGPSKQKYYSYGGNPNTIVGQLTAMANYIKERYTTPSAALAHEHANHWYAKGGFAGGAHPIIAHAGEWVVNQAQQSKLANWIGTSVGAVKNGLGFTGGPHSFQGGGVVGELEHAPDVSYLNQSFKTSESSRLPKSIDALLKRLRLLTGDTGLFAGIADQLDKLSTELSNRVSLFEAGYRVIGETIHKIRGGTSLVQLARLDLAATVETSKSLESLQRDQTDSLKKTDEEIKKLKGSKSRGDKGRYTALLKYRQSLLDTIDSTDTKIAQTYNDQFAKAAALTQAQLDQALRGRGVLNLGQVLGSITSPGSLNRVFRGLRNIGPAMRLQLAQLSQRIAQTFGQFDLLGAADQQAISALQDQRTVLEKAYRAAAAKAKKTGDPRLQKIADGILSQLQDVIGSVAEAQNQALQDAMQGADVKAQIASSVTDLAQRLASVLTAGGDLLGGAKAQIGVAQQTRQTTATQLGTYQELRDRALREGNTGAINSLNEKINDLTAQLRENELAIQQSITAYRQVAVTILQAQAQSTSGFFSAAQSIASTLGAIAGNQNLPALITYAKEAASDLLSQGQNIVQTVQATINDPANPFAGKQGQASVFLNQLTAAFQQGPQQFASALAALGPQLSSFEAMLPSDQQTLFQNLVQSMIDNTTSVVDNTQQLQQLNATTNQQQFASSAWTLFRDAIFNGLGQLLPQYALQVPAMDVGGTISSSGLLYGHKDELIVPANVMKGRSGMSGLGDTNHHWNITNPTEVADPVVLGNAVAWRLNHDPNSR